MWATSRQSQQSRYPDSSEQVATAGAFTHFTTATASHSRRPGCGSCLIGCSYMPENLPKATARSPGRSSDPQGCGERVPRTVPRGGCYSVILYPLRMHPDGYIRKLSIATWLEQRYDISIESEVCIAQPGHSVMSCPALCMSLFL